MQYIRGERIYRKRERRKESERREIEKETEKTKKYDTLRERYAVRGYYRIL